MPIHTHRHQLLEYAHQRGGYVTAAEATAAGIPRIELTRSVQHRQLIRLAPGVYQLADLSGLEAEDAMLTDLLEVQLRFPFARPCLVSALHLHGLTTTRPNRLQFAVPKNRQALVYPGLPVSTFYFGDQAYAAGLMQVPVRERHLTTYTVEKTLIDLLRLAPKFGRELYLEGFKNARRDGALNRRTLGQLARTLGGWKELARDLEVLDHDQDH